MSADNPVGLAGGWLLGALYRDRAVAPHEEGRTVSAEWAKRSRAHGAGFTPMEITLALAWLKRRGFAEKWRPEGWSHNRPLPFRLTEAGLATVEADLATEAERELSG